MQKTQDEQIEQLSAQVAKTKNLPQPAEFRTEAFQINKGLIMQIKLLIQKITKAEPLCELIESLDKRIINARTDLDQCEEKINNFMEWQDTDEASTAPKILESHKEILFTEWKSQLMKAERDISK